MREKPKAALMWALLLCHPLRGTCVTVQTSFRCPSMERKAGCLCIALLCTGFLPRAWSPDFLGCELGNPRLSCAREPHGQGSRGALWEPWAGVVSWSSGTLVCVWVEVGDPAGLLGRSHKFMEVLGDDAYAELLCRASSVTETRSLGWIGIIKPPSWEEERSRAVFVRPFLSTLTSRLAPTCAVSGGGRQPCRSPSPSPGAEHRESVFSFVSPEPDSVQPGSQKRGRQGWN